MKLNTRINYKKTCDFLVSFFYFLYKMANLRGYVVDLKIWQIIVLPV